MIASVLHLNRHDIKALKLNKLETFDYQLHKVVYQLYDDIRSEEQKRQSVPSGFLYIDKGGDFNGRQILMLSNRQPNLPEYGEISSKKIASNFLDYPHYHFEVIVNPVKCGAIRFNDEGKKKKGKIIPLKNREEITKWFIDKSVNNWGFETSSKYLEVRDIGVKKFQKGNDTVVQAQAKLVGRLTVIDKEQFIQSFQYGIGRGKAFGCGLLQIVPL
ncbi:MAG: type I-E CRISPR-associated protein Cas6/Cse3/CasE [Methylococcaceae bacterium]|nr:type I-E CRISPR-associated protein Cas6/Cse3/CasE [Methylococcaceae bacterium]